MSSLKLAIFYGSQTGNAQDLAERIWRQAKYFKIESILLPLNTYTLDLNDYIQLFICSTSGQGDVPDNMTYFWRLIMKKSLSNDAFFSSLKYCIIGLGDSTYPKYNFTAKKLNKRLLQLGCESLMDACLCDDQDRDGYESAYLKWIREFWNVVFGMDFGAFQKSHLFINSYKIEYTHEMSDALQGNVHETQASEENPCFLQVTSNKRVTCTTHWQDVRLIDFDVSHTNRMKYDAGDVLMIKAHNTRENTETFYRIFEHLHLNPTQTIKISSLDQFNNKKLNFNRIGDLVERYFDLNSVPRLSFFEIFRCFAITNELEQEKLDEFLSKEGREDLYEYCNRPRRTILEVLADFPNTTKNITKLDFLLDLIPEIKPRAYSIASSPSTHKGIIQILVAVVEFKTRLMRPRRGTCTYWLSKLKEHDELRIETWIKKGSFRVNYKRPLIAIGPGTGVAPFRSILYEKIFYHSDHSNYLYFGCRSREKDFYFQQEWQEITSNNQSSLSLYPAFSRDQDQKVYVQDLLRENAREIFELIHENDACVFIAGSAKRMPDDVLETLREIIQEYARLDNEIEDSKQYSERFMKYLEANKRIQMETWS